MRVFDGMVMTMKRMVRHEDALGRTVRVERGGFGGATLATTYAYDGLGRLVRVAADGEPTSRGLSTTGSGGARRPSMRRGTRPATGTTRTGTSPPSRTRSAA